MSDKNRYNTVVRSLFISLVLTYLRFFSSIALSLNRPSLIIGIAGSVGKSSTRDILQTLFRNQGSIKVVGNSETGIPLGILGIKPTGFGVMDWALMLLRVPFGLFFLKEVDILIVEMGIDDPFPPKNMGYLLQIIQPQVGIIVNESAAHTEQFEKTLTQKERELEDKERIELLIKRITKEDVKMIETNACQIVIYNADNSAITDEINEIKKNSQKKLFTFGKSEKNDLSYHSYDVNLEGTKMEFVFDKKSLTFKSDLLLPTVYQEVIAASLLTALASSPDFLHKEIEPQELLNNLSKNFTLPKGRGSVFPGIHNTILIDSSYNASKPSMLAYLDLLSDLKKKTKKRVIGIFGDMRELGNEAEFEHKKVAEKIIDICDEAYFIGPLSKKYMLPHLEKKVSEIKKYFQRFSDFKKKYTPSVVKVVNAIRASSATRLKCMCQGEIATKNAESNANTVCI